MSTQTADPAALANSNPGEVPHAQPVGAVVPVLVQGSRQGAGPDKRLQPFVEESKTVVVFQNGAVLRISEGVGPGQLLILKNMKSNREVACRIVKANDKMKGYFEVEFMQPEAGFWGVDFPPTENGAGNSPTNSADGHAQVAAKTEPELKPATSADLAASTEELMEDLDRALASAFASLPKAPMKMPGAPKNGDGGTSRITSPVSSIPANPFAIGDSSNGGGWGNVSSPATQPQPSAASTEGTSYTDSKKLRNGDAGLATMADFVATDSLHQSPSLGAPRFENSVAPPRANWMWVVGGVAASAVLLAVGTGIYRHYNHDKPEDLLPPVTSSAQAGSQSPRGTNTGNGGASPEQTAQQTNAIPASDATSNERNSSANRQGNPSGVPVENSGTVVTATTSRRAAILDTKIKAPASPANAASRASADPSSIQVPTSHVASDAAPLGALISGSASPAPPPAPAPARISSVVQAKLLTSVPPAYPQIAARQSIQGDVKLDLSVSEAGKVMEAKVLSGPPLLREAAAEAAKQWRYVPGKLDGTAVATHVIVTVHFELKQ